MIVGLIAAFALSLAVPVRATDVEEAEKKAVEAALKWLKLLDEGKYAESYEAAAERFKKVVTKERWIKSMNAFRKPLGKMLSRKLKAKKYTTSLPGAPDGEYVLMQFETSFENKKSAVESLTPMLDSDGEWRVSGYFIK